MERYDAKCVRGYEKKGTTMLKFMHNCDFVKVEKTGNTYTMYVYEILFGDLAGVTNIENIVSFEEDKDTPSILNVFFKEITFCEWCREHHTYHIIRRNETIDDIEFEFEEAICDKCNNPIYVGEVHDRNLEVYNKACDLNKK